MTGPTLAELVGKLPEIYQPLYGHPELTTNPSRGCEDRLVHIGALHDALGKTLGRPVRVLDFGCAQGYISLSLAARGAEVLGIDYLDANVDVCRRLASEQPGFNARFEHMQLEDRIAALVPDEFDLVLGLSVFHHIAHAVGQEETTRLLTRVAEHAAVAVYELALAQEPLYWAVSLPEDERKFLAGYDFVHELARFPTHLSEYSRPLYVASSRYWYLGGQLHEFQRATGDSHALAQGTHRGSRRYFFGSDKLAKIVELDGERGDYNRHELTREVAALQAIPKALAQRWPRMDGYDIGEREGWLVRDMLKGSLLLDVIMENGEYEPLKVLTDVLDQLVALEADGLFHNDLRVWNVLLTTAGDAVLLDYGAVGREPADCVWPDDLFLAFLIFAHDVVYREVGPVQPTLSPHVSPFSFPEPLATGFSRMWSLPREQWSFGLLREIVAETASVALDANSLGSLRGPELWIAAMERQSSNLGRFIVHHNLAIDDKHRQLKDRHEALDASVAILDRRQQAALEEIRQGQRQLTDRHEALDSAVAALGNRLSDRHEALQQSLGDRHAALDAAVAELEKKHGRASDLRDQALQALHGRLLETEQTLVELVGNLSSIQGKLDAKQRADDLTAFQRALEPVLHRIQAFEERSAQTAKKVEQLRYDSLRATDGVDELRRTLDETLHELDRTRQQLMASELARRGAQRQIEVIYASRSFKLTKPLRVVAARLRSLLPKVSGFLRPGWHRLARHAWGRRLGLMLFYPIPRLRARIYASIEAHAKIQDRPSVPVSHKLVLSPAAADIHKQLQGRLSEKQRKKV